jgi:predicted permease
MIDSFIIVFKQVFILFFLILIGFICGKVGFFKESAAKAMSDLVLYLATPCVIIAAFQREFNPAFLLNLGIAALCAGLIYVVSILLCKCIFRGEKNGEQRVLEFGTVFSNCGFMALPLQVAVLGQDGAFYGAGFLVAFNIFFWTYGVKTMAGQGFKITPKKLLLNPGLIGVALGVLLFVCSISLPELLSSPIGYIGNLNTPLPMIVIGFYLAKANLKRTFKCGKAYVSFLLRLVVIPLLALLVMSLCGVPQTVKVAVVIAASAPVAAGTTMFSAKYNADTELSVSLVSASTLLSIITMPVIVALAF